MSGRDGNDGNGHDGNGDPIPALASDDEPADVELSGDTLGHAVAARERVIDHHLAIMTERLTQLERRADAHLDIVRHHGDLLLGILRGQDKIGRDIEALSAAVRIVLERS